MYFYIQNITFIGPKSKVTTPLILCKKNKWNKLSETVPLILYFRTFIFRP